MRKSLYPEILQVLSVATALSIQSHPDKSLAERLHAERPEVSNKASLTYDRPGPSYLPHLLDNLQPDIHVIEEGGDHTSK